MSVFVFNSFTLTKAFAKMYRCQPFSIKGLCIQIGLVFSFMLADIADCCLRSIKVIKTFNHKSQKGSKGKLVKITVQNHNKTMQNKITIKSKSLGDKRQPCLQRLISV